MKSGMIGECSKDQRHKRDRHNKKKNKHTKREKRTLAEHGIYVDDTEELKVYQ